MSVHQKLKQASNDYGVPTWIISSIVEHESNFNPNAHGDKGLGVSGSWGLFQLYTGNGLGKDKSPAYLKNPDNNIKIAMDELAPAYRKAKAEGYSGFELLKRTAETSGWPVSNGNMPSSYRAGLYKAFSNGDELDGISGLRTGGNLVYKKADPGVWLTGKTYNVDPELLGRMAFMAQEKGEKINISSGYRSYEEPICNRIRFWHRLGACRINRCLQWKRTK